MNKMPKLDEPLNANERMLHGINIRLDALIHMFSSFLEVYANQNGYGQESNTLCESTSNNLEEKIQTNDVSSYSSLTKSDIQKILDEKGIEYTTRMTKAELIELL